MTMHLPELRSWVDGAESYDDFEVSYRAGADGMWVYIEIDEGHVIRLRASNLLATIAAGIA